MRPLLPTVHLIKTTPFCRSSSPKDWKWPVRRRSHTWLCAIEADLNPLNFGLLSVWKKAVILGRTGIVTFCCGCSIAREKYALRRSRVITKLVFVCLIGLITFACLFMLLFVSGWWKWCCEVKLDRTETSMIRCGFTLKLWRKMQSTDNWDWNQVGWWLRRKDWSDLAMWNVKLLIVSSTVQWWI